MAAALLERLTQRGLQFCVIDPDGDYDRLSNITVLGSDTQSPDVEKTLKLLAQPGKSVVVNTRGLPASERPAFVARLLPRLEELRARVGRPHWILIDEAEQMLPAARDAVAMALPRRVDRLVFVTGEPCDTLADEAVAAIDNALILGESAEQTLSRLLTAQKHEIPAAPLDATLQEGEALHWSLETAERRVVRLAEKSQHA